LHAWHAGQAALPQHAPSTQFPLPHWVPAVHVAPSASLGVHVPTGIIVQKLPAAQSPSLAHVVRQAWAPSHSKAPQLCVVVPHAPPPHAPASVRVVEPAGHEGAEHVVPSACFWHAPAPSHLPFVPHVEAACVAHTPFGSVTPAATGAHVPALPATLHARHDPQVAVPQQTPSTQWPVPHWLFAVQAVPCASLGRQLPAAPVQ
jgi:hypothetical protein